MSELVPVSLSLFVGQMVFRTSDAGALRQWSVDSTELLGLVTSGSIARAGEADEATLLREVVYLDIENARLIVPLGDRVEAASAATDVAIFEDDSDSSAWDDWFRVEQDIAAMLRTAQARQTELILTCEPPDGFAARCQIGTTRKGVEAVFVMQNVRSSDGPWAGASQIGKQWVLESPMTTDAITGAAQLLKIALRSHGVPPTDVFPAYVFREFAGEN